MSSLSQLYKQKDKNGTETTVKKTFLVPLPKSTSNRDLTSAKSTSFTLRNSVTPSLLANTSRRWRCR